MKSFKEYISEDDIFLSPAMSRKQNDGSYREYKPRNPVVIITRSDKIKSFTHKGKKYHLFQSRDEDLTEKTFSIMHENEKGKLKDVGEIGVVIGPGKQLIQDKIQTQLGRRHDAISLEPNFDSRHTGGGLVSRVYKMIARHHKVDLISDDYQTRGSQNLWNELSRFGKVTGVHAYREFQPFTYNPENEDHTNKIYTGGKDALLHYSHEGRVIL